MIRAIIFDCFGVFYVDPVLAYMHDPQSPPSAARALRELDERAARGLLDKAEFDRQAAAILHRSPMTIERQFFRGKQRDEALVAYAESLRSRYKMGLLSNIGADMMDGFFAPQDRAKLFDAVVLSGETAFVKPDPDIFELACERLGVPPAEAVMVDDVAENCAAARQVGMRAVQYKNFAQARAELDALLASEA